MTLRAHTIAGALLLVACGARGGLAIDDAPAERDAGARDAGGPDAGPGFDAGAPPRCELTPVAGPVVAFTGEPGGSAHAAQVEWVDSNLDVTAAMFAPGAMLPDASVGQRFTPTLALAGQFSVLAPREAHWTSRGDLRLGLCAQSAASGDATLVVRLPSGVFAQVPFLPGAACVDLAGDISGRWLSATQLPGDGGPLIAVHEADGALRTMPQPAYPETFGGGEIAVVGLSDLEGFAFAVTTQSSRSMRVGFISADGEIYAQHDIEDVRGAPGGPAIAQWPYAPDLVAVAVWSGGLKVIVVRPGRGEVMRSEDLSFSMAGDVAPALVGHPAGLIVASLGYGDADPTGGMLSVVAIDQDAEVISSFTRETFRSDDLRWGGVDVTTRGAQVALHWTETREDPAGRVPITQLMMFDCL